MDIAVVDAGANLKAFARMDGAWLGSIDIAMKKARTARFFNFPTGALGELSQPGGPLYQIEVSNGGLITFPGGVPLMAEDGTVIGAVGVSGSTVEDDHAVAAPAPRPSAGRTWPPQPRNRPRRVHPHPADAKVSTVTAMTFTIRWRYVLLRASLTETNTSQRVPEVSTSAVDGRRSSVTS